MTGLKFGLLVAPWYMSCGSKRCLDEGWGLANFQWFRSVLYDICGEFGLWIRVQSHWNLKFQFSSHVMVKGIWEWGFQARVVGLVWESCEQAQRINWRYFEVFVEVSWQVLTDFVTYGFKSLTLEIWWFVKWIHDTTSFQWFHDLVSSCRLCKDDLQGNWASLATDLCLVYKVQNLEIWQVA